MKKLTQKLLAKKQALLRITTRPDLVMERGSGAYLYDTEGRKYLDFVGGWAVNTLGHAHPALTRALEKQAAKLINASPAFYNRKMLEYAALLTELTGMDKVFFGSSGAEANESAIKLARKFGAVHKKGAYEIITFKGGFHGRTLATMSASGKADWKHLFAPKVSGFKHAQFNDLKSVEKKLTRRTCAVMLEVVQGEGGVNEGEREFLEGLGQLCRREEVLLIFDEVQTGMGRLGTLFGFQRFGVAPDLLTLAKGIGGGFPLSAMLTRKALELFEPGEQGGTYGGQPLAMAAGLAVARETVKAQLPEKAAQHGAALKQKLQQLSREFPALKMRAVRGAGLLIGFEVGPGLAPALQQASLSKGLLLNALSANTIRLMPPLIITKKQVDEFYRRFKRAAALAL